MFAGRLAELEQLEAGLLQTRARTPQNFMIVGERGIGKSSLLLYIKYLAEGKIPVDGETVRFLVVDTDLHKSVTPFGFVKKIQLAVRENLATSEKARSFLKEAWEFLQRIEAGGFGLAPRAGEPVDETMLDEFSYSLSNTVTRICSSDDSVFGAHYDGMLILIDEADNASKELGLGVFLKLLLERLQRRDCENVMVVLSGLPELRHVLIDSHESSIRLFEELELERLEPQDVRSAIEQGLKRAGELNERPFSMDETAIDFLVGLSEGFPHFVQQFCYSAFEAADGDHIEVGHVASGAVGERGAVERIGNRYYRDDFYRKIQKESYRQVLRIMAEHLDEWVTKDQIRKDFTGKASTLDNAIYALRSRHIIVSKEGTRGVYRLLNKAFAYWIKLYATKPKDMLSRQLSITERVTVNETEQHVTE